MIEEEGEVNLSPNRREWAYRHIGLETAALLAEDEKCFLRQALSTPCLDVSAAPRAAKLRTGRAAGCSIFTAITSTTPALDTRKSSPPFKRSSRNYRSPPSHDFLGH
jgi:hypothetical protein